MCDKLKLMKKVVLTISSFLFLLFLFLFLPKQTFAQGIYECRWTGSPMLAFRCVEDNESCISDFEPGNECRSYANSPSDCDGAGPFNCVGVDICGGLGEDCCTTGSQCSPGLICASGACALDQSGVGKRSPLCTGGEGEIDTAIGCIPVSNTKEFARFYLRWGLGIGGGVALILIVIAGLQITTSAGDPKKLQAGKELLTAAIMGLVLLIFSAFILRLIGVDILKIPGFGG